MSPKKTTEKISNNRMSQDIRPNQDRVLVKPSEAKDTSTGGIILPDAAKETPASGTVIAVGPGRTQEDGTLIPISVTNGDHVVFASYAGSSIEIGGEELKILRSEEILAKIEH